METLQDKDIENIKQPVLRQAKPATPSRKGCEQELGGFLFGIAFAMVVCLGIFGYLLQDIQNYEHALIELIPTVSPHQINFTTISAASFEFPLHMDVEVLDSLDANCTCDWLENDGWHCACDVPPEFVITTSRISCLVYDKLHFKLNRELFYMALYKPEGRFKNVLDVNSCKLHIRYQYHPELKNHNKTVQPAYFYPDVTHDDISQPFYFGVTHEDTSQPFYNDVGELLYQFMNGLLVLIVILFPLFVMMSIFERCRRFLTSLVN